MRSVPLFKDLDPVQLAHVASIVEEQAIKRNTVLFNEGDLPELFYFIAKGRIRISKMIPGIGEEALAILDQGAYFGEMELIDAKVPRAARALAHEDCILHTIKIADFHTLLGTDRDLAVAILWSFVKTLSERLRATNDKVTAMFALAQFK
ncbi:MAG: cyclic nucleotide-binding domain-containing protein [Deltaproteobacteria bacterium]|nr:cyclic nucleotide-binding domain-containing protein [Deltaproteobacteria bacterium]